MAQLLPTNSLIGVVISILRASEHRSSERSDPATNGRNKKDRVMIDTNSRTVPALSQTAKRSTPLPLADRRRLVRPPEKVKTPVQVFDDWASI